MPAKTPSLALIPVDRVQHLIYLIRGQRVILSPDLAELYGVSVRTMNQAVNRNRERFPDDFMFQLTWDETAIFRSQVTPSQSPANRPILRSQSVILGLEHGKYSKYRPYAFTEQGVAMLSAVLRSPTAVRVSIEIVRAFVRLRQLLATHEDLRQKLEALERRLSDHDERFTLVFDAIRELMEPPDDPPKPPVGFHTELAAPDTRNARIPPALATHRNAGIPPAFASGPIRSGIAEGDSPPGRGHSEVPARRDERRPRSRASRPDQP